MVTAHLGNFEVGSMLPAFEEDRQVHVVREKEADPEAQAFVQELLLKAGGTRYVTHFEGEHELQGWSSSTPCAMAASSASRGPATQRRPHRAGDPFRPAIPAAGRPGGPGPRRRVPLVPIFVFRVAASTTGSRSATRSLSPAPGTASGTSRRRWAGSRPSSSGPSAASPPVVLLPDVWPGPRRSRSRSPSEIRNPTLSQELALGIGIVRATPGTC